jgi:gluconolactonase
VYLLLGVLLFAGGWLLHPSTAAAQDFANIRLDKVATGYTFVEGPAWSPGGFLIFSDIPANRLLQLTPGRLAEAWRENSDGTIGNRFDAQGRLYSCESHSRRVIRSDKKGKVEVVADRYQGKRLNAPNDIAIRKEGDAYFTDPAFGNQLDTRELDFFGVYHLTRKGELELIAKPQGRPNGIALAPDGRTLYVTNSDERNVRAYDLDKSGAASNERTLISGIDGVPDGMCVDEKGNLYVAANRVEVFTAVGKPLGNIVTEETPSNCTFGDADLGSLYITARSSVYRARLNAKGFAY